LLPFLDRRQRLLVLERLRIALLARLLVEREEALELHRRAGRAEQVAAEVEVDRRRVEDGRRHLARHEALPDERIELELLGREVLRDAVGRARGIGRTDALVRALRGVILAGREEPRPVGEEVLVEVRREVLARRGGRRLRHAYVVGAHVRDETDRALGLPELDALVEVLRETHRALRAEAELLRRLLLERARLERRLGVLAALTALDARDVERLAAGEVLHDRLRRRLVVDLGLHAVEVMELRGEALPL